ncbi:hypothetical protein F4808DRAFT_426640 [Astrocystis sublimbata]|nr:hypothetical protein F4808DRAFT_426640 [Astrocystis sublimbata]
MPPAWRRVRAWSHICTSSPCALRLGTVLFLRNRACLMTDGCWLLVNGRVMGGCVPLSALSWFANAGCHGGCNVDVVYNARARSQTSTNNNSSDLLCRCASLFDIAGYDLRQCASQTTEARVKVQFSKRPLTDFAARLHAKLYTFTYIRKLMIRTRHNRCC